MKPELIHQEEALSIERIPVPGGWLYITRYWSLMANEIAISSVFVPEPHI